MKCLLFIIIMQFPCIGFGQVVKQPQGEQITFLDILSTTDTTTTKDEIYSRVIEWSGDAFNSSKTVIDVQDRQGGIVIIKAKMLVTHVALMGIIETSYGDYVLKISMKDGRIKSEMGPFLMDNINFTGIFVTTDKDCGYKGMGRKAIQRIWEAYQTSAYDTHDKILKSLTIAINNKKEW